MGNGKLASDENADKIFGMKLIGDPEIDLNPFQTHPLFYSAQATSFTGFRFGGPGALGS